MTRKKIDLHGVLLVDKPAGMTSNRVLQQLKHHLGARKAGHTGALDPLATGVLPICFGEATKFSQFLLDADKAYETRAALGARTDTADADGVVTAEASIPALTDEQIGAVLAEQFSGQIEQVPPQYSALKHEGQPLYKLAREGKPVPVKRRTVTLHESRLLARGEDWLDLYLHCSKGTYVRSFVEDLAQALGTLAHVSRLRRVRHGRFGIAETTPLEELLATPADTLQTRLLPLDTCVAELPQCLLDAEQYRRVRHGNPVAVTGSAGLVRIRYGDHFLGLGEISAEGTLKSRRLVNTDLLE
ncbi:tRNA pseudouridine(55) synthase TruB [Natronospirillum operosum]|uniref:tRNA pseudouridine synthase B n=1 Tax=Natronospirillum operosum TaxID=2759953 RepID=A0A4Z0WH64_9GAMM|nr:tRNA pseudouridine(55) synthase TruB [Natronospirillum operosum]TGG94118.1 tRNA pseudouridine(55) synthase TruB [Natronospirillum operosum]